MMGSRLVGGTSIHSKETDEEWKNLGRKIAYALFFEPTINAEESTDSKYGYEKEKEEIVDRLRDHCFEIQQDQDKNQLLIVSFIFINIYEKEKFATVQPLIKVHTKLRTYFVEMNGRTYDNWTDFTNKNKFPECTLVCPKKGIYELDSDDFVQLEKRRSADCDTARQIAKAGDVLGTIGAVGGTVLGLVGLFTPLAPVAAATLTGTMLTTGGWFVGRQTHQLIDRGTHAQTINPFGDKEVFFCWLSLVTSAFAAGSSAVVSRLSTLAQRGVQVNQSIRILSNVVIFGSMGMNGVGCIASLINLIDNAKDGKVDALAVFQFTAQILFFTNSVMSVKQASNIIKDMQRGELTQARNFFPTEEERIAFDNVLRGNQAQMGEMHGAQALIEDFHAMRGRQAAAQPQEQAQAMSRHSAFPTYDEARQGALAPQQMDQQATQVADHARNTRFGGTRQNSRAPTTVLAANPGELQNRIRRVAAGAGQSQGEHTVQLQGTWQGRNVRYDPATGQNRIDHVQVENPAFVVRDGVPVHFSAADSGPIRQVPPPPSNQSVPIVEPRPVLLPVPVVRNENELEELN